MKIEYFANQMVQPLQQSSFYETISKHCPHGVLGGLASQIVNCYICQSSNPLYVGRTAHHLLMRLGVLPLAEKGRVTSPFGDLKTSLRNWPYYIS